MYKFQQMNESNKNITSRDISDANKWFADQAGQLNSTETDPFRMFKDVGAPTIGKMYFFVYDPKTKNDLPYYDRFPLVIPLKRTPDGFIGLNLHYLPLRYRLIFLRKLLPFAIYNDEDEIKRLRITYPMLDASSKFKEFKPCIKQYLYPHIKSRILAVQHNEWDIAVFLPIQQFKKAQPREVWKDSIEEIRKS